MGNVTRSGQNNITSPSGNSLAVFVDGVSQELMLKDVRGNVEPISNYILGFGGTQNLQSVLTNGNEASDKSIKLTSDLNTSEIEIDNDSIRLSDGEFQTLIQQSPNQVGNVTLLTPPKTVGAYTIGTLEDVSQVVSGTQVGIVNNCLLQELGGADKSINGVRIGRSGSSSGTNTIVGGWSMASVTTADFSTAVGFLTLSVMTSSGFNTALGTEALPSSTTAIGNVAVGASSSKCNLTGSFNTSVGTGALCANKYGSQNIGIGNGSLGKNVGVNGSSVCGHRSVGVGNSSFGCNTTGNGVAVGFCSLGRQTTGINNIALGTSTASGVTTGNNNVILGHAGYVGAGCGVSSGSNNLIVTQNNGTITGIITGSGNTILGKASGLSASLTNTVILSDGNGSQKFISSSTNLSTLPLQTTAIIAGDATGKAIIVKEFLPTGISDNVATNSTTTALTEVQLTTAYPTALRGFKAQAVSIGTGGLIYEKTDTGWCSYSITVVV